jgi:hypothetical protein
MGTQEHAPFSSSNMSYLFLNDTLVAPIVDMENNVSTRSVRKKALSAIFTG